MTKKLVVELTDRSDAILGVFVEREGLNKTTIVNRALSVYHTIQGALLNGDRVLIQDRENLYLSDVVMVDGSEARRP